MTDTVSQSSSEHTAGSEYYDRWQGVGLKDMYGSIGPWNYNITPIATAEDHIVLCEIPLDLSAPPKPRADANKQFWHDDFVRMPFAEQCFSALESDGSILCLATKWKVIRAAYSRPIVRVRDFENAVRKYHPDLPRFKTLKFYLKSLDEEERSDFFSVILPGVVQLALQLPRLFPCGIPLLKRNKWCSLTMSQEQISSILCNGFLCTYTNTEEDHYNPNYPDINFSRLFSSKREPTDTRIQSMVAEKLKCLMNYFKRIIAEAPKGIVTFERKYLKDSDMPIWEKNDKPLGGIKIHVSATGSIEDNGKGLCQISFANRYIGGGVLGFGCIQEEIRFVTYPELIAARLFTEVLGPNEVLLTIGAERYSNHTGYSNYFKFMGNSKDDTPYDNYGRRKLNILSMDATSFNTVLEQFKETYIRKELNKAYVGFFSSTGSKQPIATGNWGCGAFRGDPFLKAMVQYLACTATGRDLVYYTFGSVHLQNDIYKCFRVVVDKKLTVAQLYKILIQYDRIQDRPGDFFDYFCPAVYRLKSNPIARMLGLSSSSEDGTSTTFCAIKCIDPCGSPSYGSSREDINRRRSQD